MEEQIKDIINYLLNENNLWNLRQSDIDIDDNFKEEIKRYILKNHSQYGYNFRELFDWFFESKFELIEFIKNNRELFVEYINTATNISPSLLNIDEFVEIVLTEKKYDSVKFINLDKLSPSNLKLLSIAINDGVLIPYYKANYRVAHHIFENKDNLDFNELATLLTIFQDKRNYEKYSHNPDINNFNNLIKDNIDYLIRMVLETGIIPKCLVENHLFRDECLKRNLFDIAIKCVLPSDIITNEELVNKYSQALNIEPKALYERIKWLIDYQKRNNNIFNTIVASMLKDNIFNIAEHHFERFINDVGIQNSLVNLNDLELKVVLKILERFNYQDFDVSFMIYNIISNINNYKELISSLNIDELSIEELDKLIRVLQFKQNEYQIKNREDLNNVETLKKNKCLENINKENLLKYLFNISLDQAKLINLQYCYNKNGCILEGLKSSELPSDIYNILFTINQIVETDDINKYYTDNIYNLPIPLETYLRSQYAKLYSKSLYKVNNQISSTNERPDKIIKEIEYNGQRVQFCIPQESFKFLIHCLGTCSEKIDSDFYRDWEYRPQIQDHFVACSFISEKMVALRTDYTVMYGFNDVEGGALYGMSDTDIDSIGPYAMAYNASNEFMALQSRAHFLPPSIMIENSEGYNEFVIERRSKSGNIKENFKRSPDYIIMSVDSVENSNNFICLDDLFKSMSFLTEEEKDRIKKIDSRIEIRKIIFNQLSKIESKDNVKYLTNYYTDNILKAKYYEQCLKATIDFNIPLIIIDRLHYFKRMLSEGSYDQEAKDEILKLYLESDESKQRDIFKSVSKNKQYDEILKKSTEGLIQITI